MLNSKKQDQRRRNIAKKLELKRLQTRVILQDINLFLDKNKTGMLQSSDKQRTLRTQNVRSVQHVFPTSTKTSLPSKKGSIERIQNYCVLTGRSKGVFQFCKLSRIRFREMGSKTLLNGINKASW